MEENNAKKISELITTPQLAKATGIHEQTIRRWHQRGILMPTLVAYDGTRYYDPNIVDDILNGRVCFTKPRQKEKGE